MCENIISLKIIYRVNVTSLYDTEIFQGRGQLHPGLHVHSLVTLCQKYRGDIMGVVL